MKHIVKPKKMERPGLPDGSFSNQKSRFGLILCGLRLESVYIFYIHLGYFMEIWGFCMAIWYILYPLGTFFRFWYQVPREIWQPWERPALFRESFSITDI
jgi:hypothetical protein